MTWPASESDLGPPLINWLEADGWEVFQEVQVMRDGPRADVIAVRNRQVWVFELKKRLGLDVIEQAAYWTRYAHFSSAVVATSKYGHRTGLIYEVCEWKRIGVIEVIEPSGWRGDAPLRHRTAPPLHRRARAGKVLDRLRPQHKTFAPAGNDQSKHWSPYRETCHQLELLVRANPGVLLMDAINSIKHHYANPASAKSSLAKWIQEGKLPAIESRVEGQRIRLYPR